jgi:tRNA-dihydrouridine synthase B
MPNAPELSPDIRPDLQLPAGPFPDVSGFVIGGQVRVENPFVLAPMSGVTDSPFRRMVQTAAGGAVGLLVTEFISIEGLTRANMKAAARMAFHEDEKPLSVQIFGADIERMVHAAQIIEESGAQVVDINCGCPAPKVVKRGGGAELLRHCDHLARLVEATAKAVKIPVTVKIRSGWSHDSINAIQVAKAVESAGAQMLAVHGRTRVQLYTGEADWTIVDEVAQTIGIPVVGSGDVCTPEEAVWRYRSTAASGVMIGRAAIMNPWIFGQIADLVAGRPVRVVGNAERVRLLQHFRDMMQGMMPEHAIPGRLKQLLARMTKGFCYGSLLREKAMRARTTEEMFHWIESFFAAEGEEAIEAWALQARASQTATQVALADPEAAMDLGERDAA